MQQARINIVEPNGVRRSMPIGPQGMTIGRDPDCDVVIAYERASRYHAQVTFDGERYYVTDLDSRNGTFLGNRQLPPDVPTEWPLGMPMRIGEIKFQLESAYGSGARGEEGFAEFAPDDEQSEGGMGQMMLWGTIGLGLLCGCIGVGAAAYLFLGS